MIILGLIQKRVKPVPNSWNVGAWVQWLAFIMYARCRCMVEFACTIEHFFLCADFRPEAAIETTRCESCHTDLSSIW
jgi:hypothetical protein